MGQDGLLAGYRAHERELFGFLVKRLQCVASAADVSQELYLRLLTARHPAGIGNVRAYLFRMAGNLASDHQRGERRRDRSQSDATALLWSVTDERTPERQAIAQAELAALRRAVAGLPARSRYIFHQNRFAGRSQREIADELGISTTAVEKHMRRVLRVLADARAQ